MIKYILVLLKFLILTSSVLPQDRSIAVTVDDLPFVRGDKDSAVYTNLSADLLKHFKKFDIPAVGFVNEGKLYEEGTLQTFRIKALELWLNSGFELGNHTYSHWSLNRIPLEQFTEDIEKGEQITKEISKMYNLPYRYFRHPYLQTGRSLDVRDSLNMYLNSKGYKVAPVTVDNSEWVFALAYDNAWRDGDSAAMRLVISEYIPYMIEKIGYYEQQSLALFGYNIKHILLIHANRLNAAAGDSLFYAIRKEGYRFITLDEALEDPAYSSEDNFTGAGGISWLHRWALAKGKKKEFFKGENAVPDNIMKLSGVENE